jgi:hypothetical protein
VKRLFCTAALAVGIAAVFLLPWGTLPGTRACAFGDELNGLGGGLSDGYYTRYGRGYGMYSGYGTGPYGDGWGRGTVSHAYYDGFAPPGGYAYRPYNVRANQPYGSRAFRPYGRAVYDPYGSGGHLYYGH